MLTAAQRYRQAMQKARIFNARQVRLLIEGKQDYAEGGKEREYLIAEIKRAYDAGFREGRRAALAEKEEEK